jgi:sugar/nucleoside kinase (ribokinase family)
MKPPVPAKSGQPFDAVCFGYNSCDMLCLLPALPPPDGKTRMEAFLRAGGGQAATAAAAVARLGLRSRYLGKFGDTPEGGFARRTLAEDGVDLAGCLIAPNTQNQLASIWVDRAAGTRAIAALREPGLEIARGEIKREFAVSGAALLLDGHHVAACLQLARWARDEGIPVLLDASKNQAGMSDLLDLTDYALCDAQFPVEYTGEGQPAAALRVMAKRHYLPLAAVTTGAAGSLTLVDGQFIATPAYRVDVVDTTGAGDVWHGAFVAGLVWGLELEQILRVAAAAAAMKCRRLGGRAGIPSRRELEAFLLQDASGR